jgi:hypothetical protein
MSSDATARKIPFPGNGDRSSQRLGSNLRLLRGKTEYFVVADA